MKAFFIHLRIQFLIDLREKATLLTVYLVPLAFYGVMGAVFSSINPDSRQTLAASMAIFAVTMGAVLGMPAPLVKLREGGVLRAFEVSGVPGWAVLLTHAVSALMHLTVVALLIFFTAPLFFGAMIPVNVAAYFLILTTLLFASVALGLLLGVSAKSQGAATMLSQLVFMPSLLLGGLMFPTELLPEPFLWLGRLFPATHAMDAFRAWAFGLPQSIAPALSLTVIAAIGCAALVMAVWRFRRLFRTL